MCTKNPTIKGQIKSPRRIWWGKFLSTVSFKKRFSDLPYWYFEKQSAASNMKRTAPFASAASPCCLAVLCYRKLSTSDWGSVRCFYLHSLHSNTESFKRNCKTQISFHLLPIWSAWGEEKVLWHCGIPGRSWSNRLYPRVNNLSRQGKCDGLRKRKQF